MEKTLRYTTLKGLISKTNQFSFNTFLSGRMYHNKHGWVKFKVTDKVREQIENIFKSVVGDVYLYCGKSYGIFDRLIINNRLEGQYIAGQEYSSELRYLKKLIRGL